MYTKGEVIWAKIKGFPWWPGIIAKVIDDKESSHGITELLVNFVGENSHAQLTLDKVAKYQEKYDEYAKMKKKKLLHSIEIANKIVKGETTFQVEYEKLEDKDIFTNKKLPTHNPAGNQRKRVDSKSDEKSPSNGLPYESDDTSPNGSEANHLLMSPYDSSKTHQANGRKYSRKGSDVIVARKSSQVEKSPALNKNMRNRANSKREAEENLESEEPKLMKAFKLDGNTDELQVPKQKEDEITEKADKTGSKSSPILNNIDAAFSFNNTVVIESFNAKNSRKNSIALINNSNNNTTEHTIAKTNEFDILRDLIIEKITNSGSPSVCGTILEKSIEDVISKINPETVSVSEIVENDLGKNIYTLIILLDELFSSVPIEADSTLYDLKDQLVTFNDIIKSRLVLHFAENADFCSVWLKKLEKKRDEKAAVKVLEEVKKPQQPLKLAENVEKKEKTEKTTRKLTEGSENTNQLQMDEEKPVGTLQINFEEYRFEGEKKKSGLIDRVPKMVTTTAKITKPIYKSAAENLKMDSAQKSNVINTTLRKKICMKMAKILQDKYNLEKNASQEMTLKIETKIRNIYPDMQMEYKNKILIVLKLLKYSLIDIQDFVTNFNTDFYTLQQKLEAYTKQNADAHLDTNFGEDSPSLAKEISQDAALISLKLDEFKNGESQEGIAQLA